MESASKDTRHSYSREYGRAVRIISPFLANFLSSFPSSFFPISRFHEYEDEEKKKKKERQGEKEKERRRRRIASYGMIRVQPRRELVKDYS